MGIGRESEFHDGLFLLFAEEDADGGVLFGRFDVAIEVVHIHLHLAEILMVELVELEVDEHIAAQKAVVKDKVHEEVVFVEGKALLTGLEEEAFTKFEQKVLDAIDDSLFEV